MKEFDRIITTTDGHRIRRVSRWLRIQQIWVTSRHSLAQYADGDGCGWLYFFEYRGHRYALRRFTRCGGMWAAPVMWYDEAGRLQHLAGVDSEDWHNPLMIEMDDSGEHVRVYESID